MPGPWPMLTVTLPVEPPPARPLPATTPVIVPPEFVSVSASFAHAHVAPFHLRSWPAAQVVSRPSVTLPLVPPPARPVPAATPVIVPPELVSVSTSFAQPHATPLHLRSWPAAQPVVIEIVTLPLVPPPIRPVPAIT